MKPLRRRSSKSTDLAGMNVFNGNCSMASLVLDGTTIESVDFDRLMFETQRRGEQKKKVSSLQEKQRVR